MLPLVSIIIPVYNAEEYLINCLDSVVNQIYENIEIILVNDGSIDDSGMICNEYAEKDCRIKVIHKANRGVSHSRNIGIKNANGEYILFIDCDDSINNDYVNMMVKPVIDNDCDLVISCIEDVYKNISKIRQINMIDLTYKFTKDYKILKDLLRAPYVKLYKKEILEKNNIEFPEDMKLSEDQVFNFQYYSKIKNYKFINYCGYKYFHRSTISLSKNIDKKAFIDEIKRLKLEKAFYNNSYIENKEKIFCCSALGIISKYFYLSDIDNSFNNFKERISEIKKLLYGFNYYDNFKQCFVLKCLKYNLWYLLYWSYKFKLLVQRIR